MVLPGKGISRKDATEIIALIAGVIGLIAALLNYLEVRAKREERARLGKQTSVTIVQVPRRRLSKWPWELAKWGFFCMAIGLLVDSCFNMFGWIRTGSRDQLGTGIWALIGAALYYFAASKFRPGPRAATTPARRQRRIVVEANYEVLMERCRRALLSLNAEIMHFDRDKGLIEARTAMGLRTFGEKLRVLVSEEVQGSRYMVEITSDYRAPFALFDSGRNSKHVRRFIDFLGG